MALAAIVVALVIWNVTLQAGSDGLNETHQSLIETIEGGAGVAALSGTGAAPDAGASLIYATDGSVGFLVIRYLPSLPSDREYEVWHIEDGDPVSVGTFAARAAGESSVTFAHDFSGAETVGVSIEQLGGSLTGKPTPGAIVLLGNLQSS